MQQPIFQQLENTKTILLAGAGGGFDVFTGLPLYFALRKMGKTVHLANLSFSRIYATYGSPIGPALVEVNAQTQPHLIYFPELYLAQWLAERGEPDTIFCFDRTGAKPIRESYQILAERLQPDAVVLVDGGTDSLMRGDEAGLGTPEEDIASIAAVDALSVPIKMLVSLGFGIDTFHGVCHAHFLEAMAAIVQDGSFLGSWSLCPTMPEFALYKEACAYTFARMPNHPSIVNTSIISAVEGNFGNHHANYRTEGSELFINPLMSLYFAFQLEPIVKRNLYIDLIRETESYQELQLTIERFRYSLQTHKPWQNLPM